MSFDIIGDLLCLSNLASIPLEQGNVFRQENKLWHIVNLQVSIPFEQGDVFRRFQNVKFRLFKSVSIPFEQGDVFRLPKF